MDASITDLTLPVPPETLRYVDVVLRFVGVVFGDSDRGIIPYYHFRILIAGNEDAGHINFRVGETEHVRNFVGHVGFEMAEAFRGRGYAGQACRALAPFLRSVYPVVILTCDPDNLASRRTIEDLGASYMDEVDVPPHDPQYERGSRSKRRYAWMP